MCPAINSDKVHRDKGNKWYISYEDLPRDTKKYPGDTMEFYPTYCKGAIYIVNPGTARSLAEVRKIAQGCQKITIC